MGMNQNAAGLFQPGTDLAGSVYQLLTGTGISPGRGSEAEESARLKEFEASVKAQDILRRADADADALRTDREARRGTQNAAWGASGLAMSGSKELLRQSARIKDGQDEEDLRAEGAEAARDALNQGRAAGNLTRINGSVPISGAANTQGSILSSGSKIYKYGRWS
ncbi:hypothetical protein GKC30_06415 [Pseudodesulfovibrio sp. F-1]|uniref:Uncharacterized protein n=1 Tax=Pseudodesulfovibrio alkaliphilus TaxID=2661613 RepID=A0A7K1KMJ1_9BACT|nr:hypothetical protein [Pseudodesulfovibrio alkaliphilus]MUM77260.1 hypothetical protein [Pseudodesulfovibrio alkaliphilus]